MDAYPDKTSGQLFTYYVVVDPTHKQKADNVNALPLTKKLRNVGGKALNTYSNTLLSYIIFRAVVA